VVAYALEARAALALVCPVVEERAPWGKSVMREPPRTARSDFE
jgi:hypothetical protein